MAQYDTSVAHHKGQRVGCQRMPGTKVAGRTGRTVKVLTACGPPDIRGATLEEGATMAQQGIGPHLAALVVPFTAQDTVDEAALRGLIRYVAGTKLMNGVVVNAHAGEVASLTLEERRRVVEVMTD